MPAMPASSGPGSPGRLGRRDRPAPLDLPGRLPGPARGPHAGVVHAPGRPLAARVPGAAGRGQHPRRHRPARPGRRDHPAARAPLRRRRRHPLLRHRRAGRRHRLRRRRRPRHRAGGGRSRSARRPTSTACAPSSPRPTRPTCWRPCAILAGGARRRPAHRLRRGALHGGQLPRRGPAVARPTPAPRRSCTATPGCGTELVDRLADLAIASLRSQVGAGAEAVQLFDSWAGALARPTTSASCCRPAARCSPASPTWACPRIHFGVGTGELLELMAAAGADVVGVDWRVPLDVARDRVGARRGRAGQPRPGGLPGPVAVVAERTRRRARPQRAAAPATSSTWATACSPDTDPACSTAGGRAWSTPSTAAGGCRSGGALRPSACVVMAYGTPRRARRPRGATTPHIRRGRPPSPTSWPTWPRRYDAIGGLSRRWPRAPRPSGPACRRPSTGSGPGAFVVVAGPEARRRRSSRTAWPSWPPPASTGAVGLVLAPHYSAVSVGEYLARAEAAGGHRGACPAGPSSSGTWSRRTSTSWPRGRGPAWRAAGGAPRSLFTAHCLPERVLADGDPYPDQLRGHRRRRRRAAPGCARGPAGGWPGRAPGARPSRGWGPTSSTCSATSPARRHRGRAGVPRGVRVRPPRGGSTTSTSRPPAWPTEAGPRLRPHRRR